MVSRALGLHRNLTHALAVRLFTGLEAPPGGLYMRKLPIFVVERRDSNPLPRHYEKGRPPPARWRSDLRPAPSKWRDNSQNL